MKRHMHRRDFLQLSASVAGAATLGSALAACGGGGTTASKKTVTLEYWDWIPQDPWVTQEIKLFQQANPGIKIHQTTIGNNTYNQTYALAQKGGKTPDVAMIPQTPLFNDQMAQGWWLPLNKWATDSWKAQFPEGTLLEGSNMLNGKIYTLPLLTPGPTLQLYINNKVFRQAGLTNSDGSIKLPQVWDDVTHAAETIVKKSNGSVYGLGFGNATFTLTQWWPEVFVRGAGCPGGGYVMDYRIGKYNYHDRNYVDFMNLMLEWKKKGYVFPNALSAGVDIADGTFMRGGFGMTITGVWAQPRWHRNDHFDDYSIVPLIPPSLPLKGYYYRKLGGWYFGIPATTKHPDEAWAWFNWLNSPEAGKRYVQEAEGLSMFPQNNNPSYASFSAFSQFLAARDTCLPGPDPLIRNPQTAFVVPKTVSRDLGQLMTGAYSGQIPIQNFQSELSALDDQLNKALTDAIALAVSQGHKVSIQDYTFPDWDITKPYKTRPNS